MGCDIHLHIEVKTENGWEHYASPNFRRSYSLFEKMAGVRGDIENAISSPKGFPNDASYITERSYKSEVSYAHSVSWLNVKEINELSEWIQSQPGDGLSNDLEHGILHTYLEGNSFCGDFPDWIKDVRFVFWFDN